MDWWKEEYTKMTERTIGFIEKKGDTVWNKTIDCAIRIVQLALANIPETRGRIFRRFWKKCGLT